MTTNARHCNGIVDKIYQTWLCSWSFVMSDHPPSPPIPSLSVDSDLLLPPTITPVLPFIVNTKLYTHPTPKCIHFDQYSHIKQDIWEPQLHLWDTWQRFCQLLSCTKDQWLFLGVMPLLQYLKILLISPNTPVSKIEGSFCELFECQERDTPSICRVFCFYTYCALPAFIR